MSRYGRRDFCETLREKESENLCPKQKSERPLQAADKPRQARYAQKNAVEIPTFNHSGYACFGTSL